MYSTHRPALAAGFTAGKVGTPLSSGSAHMHGVCSGGLWRGRGDSKRLICPPCAVVVVREDGIEPLLDLAAALAHLRRLYAATRDERLVVPGKALASLCDGAAARDEVIAALAFAADGSRWAPWIQAVTETVRMC